MLIQFPKTPTPETPDMDVRRRWAQRIRDRRELAHLADLGATETLADAGLTVDEARALAHKPFWRR